MADNQPQILPALDFERYAYEWQKFLSQATSDQLAQLFRPNGQYQAFISFDLSYTILSLISTPCIAQVVTSFVLLPAQSGAAGSQFQVVVSAADAMGNRISPYYLGTIGWLDSPSSTSKPAQTTDDLSDNSATGAQVPYNLVQCWVNNWASNTEFSKDQFATAAYGPLNGFAFDLSDFVSPLFNMLPSSIADYSLRLVLGLKPYYLPTARDAEDGPASIIGLIVRLAPNPGVPAAQASQLGEVVEKLEGKVEEVWRGITNSFTGWRGAAGASGEPSYDLSNPIPPGM